MGRLDNTTVFLTGVLLLVIAVVLTPINSAPINTIGITGFATYSPTAVSSPIDTNLFFSSASSVVTRSFTVSDNLIYSRGYVSYSGRSWQPIRITPMGTASSNRLGWIQESGIVNITFTPTKLRLSLSRPTTDNTYIIIYTCTNAVAGTTSNSRDCHGGWQKIQFTAAIDPSNYNSTIPNPSIPPINNNGSNNNNGATQSCTGNPTQTCLVTNGAGIQTRTCNTATGQWNAYGTCTITNCNTGYHSAGNTCIIDSVIVPTFSESPTITFISPTPSNGATINSPNTKIVANVVDDSNALSSWIDFDNSLIGYWSMDSYSTSGIYDNSTYKNLATFTNGIGTNNIATGIRGKAISFDGVDDGLNLPTSLSVANKNEVTLSMWTYFSDVSSAQTLYNDNIANNDLWKFALNHGLIESSKLDVEFRNTISGDTGTKISLVSTANTPVNQWVHIAVVYSVSNNYAKIYLNGNEVGSSTSNIAAFTSTPSSLIKIGNDANDAPPEAFKGSMDEVMLFKRALSPTEIKSLYDSKNNKFDATFSNLANGGHTYTVYAADNSGSFGVSESRTLNVQSSISSLTCTGANTESCTTVTNAAVSTRTRTCDTSTGTWGVPYGTCMPTTCISGYHISGSSCVVDITTTCSGSSTQACGINFGSGSQSRTCNTATGLWSAYTSCTVVSCNVGYHISGNTCAIDLVATPTCGDGNCNGAETCSTCSTDCGTCQVLGTGTNCGTSVTCPSGLTCSNGLCISASGKTYYVATSANGGSDTSGDGSFAKPWATWQKGFNSLSAGYILYIRGGTYTPSGSLYGVTIDGRSGQSTKPIYVWAYPLETPILDGSSLSTSDSREGINFGNANYWHLKGLTVANVKQINSGAGGMGFALFSSNNNIIENCKAYGNGGVGFFLRDTSTGNTFLNCDAYSNYDPYSSSGAGDDADGFDLGWTAAGTTNTLIGCRSWNNSDDGYDLYHNDGNVIFKNCWAWSNGYGAGGQGVGFKMGLTSINNPSTTLRTATNCIAYKNNQRGFGQESANLKMIFYNNIAYLNDEAGFDFTFYNVADILRNNIAYNNGNGNVLQSNQIRDHNSWDSGVTIDANDFISLDATQLLRPRKADGSLPDMDFLHLKSGSDLIDKGVNVGVSYSGSAPDLGAFEYSSSSITTAGTVLSCSGSSTQTCGINYGSGIQSRTCNTATGLWSAYNTCTVTNCNIGYHISGNMCAADTTITTTCAGLATQTCLVTNGAGTQSRTCNTATGQWNTYGTCTVTSCNLGYTQSGNTCVSSTTTSSKQFTIDYTKPLKSMNMVYCIQEEGGPNQWATTSLIQQNHQDVAGVGGYERIWLRRAETYENYLDNIPLMDDCKTWDYTKLQKLIQITLDKSMIPYVSFGNSPYCFVKNKVSSHDSDGSAVNPVMPDDLTVMANYSATVVKWAYDSCNSGVLKNCGDFANWRWEIGNEPYDLGVSGDYATWFDSSAKEIKKRVPTAKVGMGFIDYSDTLNTYISTFGRVSVKPDFIDIHFYDSGGSADPAFGGSETFDQFVDGTKGYYYTEFNRIVNGIHKSYPNIQVYNFEYNMDSGFVQKNGNWATVKYIQTKEGAAWYASSLYWQMKTNISGECFYEGTDRETVPLLGMWNIAGQSPFPTYTMKKSWVSTFKKGNNLYYATPEDSGVEIVANDVGLVIINKHNQAITITVSFTGKSIAAKTYTLSPYDVIFNYY